MIKFAYKLTKNTQITILPIDTIKMCNTYIIQSRQFLSNHF